MNSMFLYVILQRIFYMRYFFLLFFLFPTLSFAAEEGCAEFADKLEKCAFYTCTMPHPDVPGFRLRHHIAGFTPEDKCVHTQTTPDNALIRCSYNEPGRMVIASLFRHRDHDIDKGNMELLNNMFQQDCKVTPY